jgi:hypothetical protein
MYKWVKKWLRKPNRFRRFHIADRPQLRDITAFTQVKKVASLCKASFLGAVEYVNSKEAKKGEAPYDPEQEEQEWLAEADKGTAQ